MRGGRSPHPNGCILLARVPAARAGGVRRGLGADPVPAGEFSEGDDWGIRQTRETAKSAEKCNFSENGGISLNLVKFSEMGEIY